MSTATTTREDKTAALTIIKQLPIDVRARWQMKNSNGAWSPNSLSYSNALLHLPNSRRPRRGIVSIILTAADLYDVVMVAGFDEPLRVEGLNVEQLVNFLRGE